MIWYLTHQLPRRIAVMLPLQVLNLFLALLLSSFGAESLQQSQDDSEPNKLQEAVDRINRFVTFIKSHIMYCVKVRMKRKSLLDDFDPSLTKTDLSSKEILVDGDVPMRNGRICEHDSPDGDDDSYQDRKGKNHLFLDFLLCPLISLYGNASCMMTLAERSLIILAK